MNENLITTEKPNLRNKGSRMGVKTGNTIKFDHYSQGEINKTSTFCIQKIDVALTKNKSSSQMYWTNQKDPQWATIELSLNKNKAWEKIENTKNDPDYIVDEQFGMYRDNMEIMDKYKKPKPKNEEKEEGEWEIVKGRKGKT
jgi:hypothetical protein